MGSDFIPSLGLLQTDNTGSTDFMGSTKQSLIKTESKIKEETKNKDIENRTKFRNAQAEFVFYRSYSRWLDDKNRREYWDETVERYIKFIVDERGSLIPPKVIRKIREYMLSFSVMPSMRALWAAGDAARQSNMTMYNCTYVNIDCIEAFSEVLLALLCGSGVGFSVERKHIEKLPEVPMLTGEGVGTYVIEDSRAGWAKSVDLLFRAMYQGKDIELDYSLIRPKGARLKTMGGRSSGPYPLVTLHDFIRKMFNKAQGRKFKPIEVLDLLNRIAEVVVVGGIRRSSQISLSDLDDTEMRDAKVWPFPLYRAMSNNSAVFYSKPSAVDFLKEWSTLASSGTGERGIFNLGGARRRAPHRRDASLLDGTNPCGEIVLRSAECCNLSEVVVRPDDDLDSLLDKVETATWLGAIQSTFTHFPHFRKRWAKNCNEERLLGVSLTGQMDAPHLLTPDALKAMKSRALKVAARAADKLGINMPAAITTTKPSGTVSQVTDSSSGLHPRYSKFYIRRYRISANDPLLKMMKDQGVPMTPENGEGPEDIRNWNESKVNTWVVGFPVAAPKGCITKDELSALDQFNWYKNIMENWCEHSASCTIYVKDDEWFSLGATVYENFDLINGLSFLPADNGAYKQAPYEAITEEEYSKLSAEFPKIDYSQLYKYETDDNTSGAKTWACSGDKCELT